ncbi:MAG: hypothetical protein IJW40_05325 [Clostridia bacterium]|nr:hypothetical protein [Clostridia bacterium]
MLLYHIDGVRINDSWYVRKDGVYHTFFLAYGEDEPTEGQWDRQRVGHMISTDLITWEDRGIALCPQSDGWNDKGIATGSVVPCGDVFYMLYSGNATDPAREGIGLAVSRDLDTWERLGDGPVIFKGKPYAFSYGKETVHGLPIADPYVYPEPIDGNYYIFVNGHIAENPVNRRGAQLVFVTRDFRTFTPHAIAVIGECDRLETAQVWAHDGRFYLYAGQVEMVGQQQRMKNSLYTAEHIDGPYTYRGDLAFPEQPENGMLYIAKVLPDPTGRDVLLVNNIPNGVMGAYPVTYHADGTLTLEAMP